MSEHDDRAGANWLGLAAAPSYAAMALLTTIVDGGRLAAICSAVQEPSWLGGMVPMYWLMSALHLAPWLERLRARLFRLRT